MGDSPAFQFYPSDWLVGTLTFSLAEEAAYLRCVMHQWGAGFIPGDDMRALARIMRVGERDAVKLWAVVRAKFERGDDGLWRNPRLERERQKQADYRQSRVESGRRGGLAKAKRDPRSPTISLDVRQELASVSLVAKPLAKSSSSSSSSSSSLKNAPSKNDGAARGPGLIASSLDVEKRKRFNAYVGARLDVPHKLHQDFMRALGGTNPDAALREWYAGIDAEIELSGEAIIPDIWKWLEARFKPWATNATSDAAMAQWAAEA